MPRVDWPGVGVIDVSDKDYDPSKLKASVQRYIESQAGPRGEPGQYRIEAAPRPTIQTAVPPDAQLRARTLPDKVQDVRDQVGRTIAPALGLNFDEMTDGQARGISIAMLPFMTRLGAVTPEPIEASKFRRGSQTYYRAHWKDAPEFSAENASSAPWGESEAARQPGYSSLSSAEQLMRYFKNRGGLPADDAADVVIYRGSPVGAGPDNEPLV